MSLQCRVCLFKVDIDSSIDLFSEARSGELISEVLTSFAPVCIFKGDGLPDRICLNCEEKLNAVLDFRFLLISSDSKLQQIPVGSSCEENFTKENVKQNMELIEDCIKIEPETIQERCESSVNNLMCDICGKSFSSLRHLEKHSLMHDLDKPFKCYDCETAFMSIAAFEQHKKYVHSETGYTCGQLLETDESFQIDMPLHSAEKKSFIMNEIHSTPDPSHTSGSDGSTSYPTESEQLMECENGEELLCLPPEIEETAKVVTLNLLPLKSRTKYEKAYENFVTWCTQKNVKCCSENVLLAFFAEESKRYNAASLWSRYSMIKSCLQVKKNVDISKYNRLTAFLKRQNKGYKPKKSNVFNREHLMRFIAEAPDESYLAIKVAFIFGIAGGCRREELANLTVDDIEDLGSCLLVTIKTAKAKRVFTIVDNKMESVKVLDVIRKYKALRPVQIKHRRFFLFYKNGKCSSQVIGKNTFGLYPSRIATFLKLPQPSTYTGHSFRRSSATIFVNGGADLTQLKRRAGSPSTAEDCIDSVQDKSKSANIVLHGANSTGTTSTVNEAGTSINLSKYVNTNFVANIPSSIMMSNNNNCTINVIMKNN